MKASFVLWLALAATAYAEQASVHFGETIRPLNQVGAGVLLSVSDTAPAEPLLAGIKPTIFRGEPGSVSFTKAMQYNAQFQMGMAPSFLPPLPGDNGDWTAWEARGRALASLPEASNPNVQIEIWNEPDQPYFWRRSYDQYMEAWKHGVNAVRGTNPQATIVGPSTSNYWWFVNLNVEQVLTYAKANDVLPDVVSWHSWGRSLGSEIDQLRAFGASHDIDVSRISINEYLWWFDEYRPGPIVYFLNTFEQKQVESGIKSCWTSCSDNSLDGRVTPDGQPRSIWWLYQRFAQMGGQSVVTVSGNDTLDVLASQDDGIAYALVGRYHDTYVQYLTSWTRIDPPDVIAPANVLLQHLDDVPNLLVDGRVHVLAELIKNSEQAASAGPVVMIDADFLVTDGALNLSLTDFGTYDAYALTLTRPLGLPGDLNSDGCVDAADYVVLRQSRPTAYDTWRNNYGTATTLGAAAVPETPVSILLLWVVPWFTSWRRA